MIFSLFVRCYIISPIKHIAQTKKKMYAKDFVKMNRKSQEKESIKTLSIGSSILQLNDTFYIHDTITAKQTET